MTVRIIKRCHAQLSMRAIQRGMAKEHVRVRDYFSDRGGIGHRQIGPVVGCTRRESEPDRRDDTGDA